MWAKSFTTGFAGRGSCTQQSFDSKLWAPGLQDIAAIIEDAQGSNFLRELKLRWDNHNKSMQMIRDILMVRHPHDSSTVSSIHKMPDIQWRIEERTTGIGHIGLRSLLRGLQYMDRIYVKHQNKVPVHQLGLNLWRDTVVRSPRIQVIAHVCSEVMTGRQLYVRWYPCRSAAVAAVCSGPAGIILPYETHQAGELQRPCALKHLTGARRTGCSPSCWIW